MRDNPGLEGIPIGADRDPLKTDFFLPKHLLELPTGGVLFRRLFTAYDKRMPSAFFETPLQSLLVWHKVDTLVVTGGSTSGCVRATAVESLSWGYRTIETTADKHESYHYANLTNLQLKYADVEPVQAAIDWLEAYDV